VIGEHIAYEGMGVMVVVERRKRLKEKGGERHEMRMCLLLNCCGCERVLGGCGILEYFIHHWAYIYREA